MLFWLNTIHAQYIKSIFVPLRMFHFVNSQQMSVMKIFTKDVTSLSYVICLYLDINADSFIVN